MIIIIIVIVVITIITIVVVDGGIRVEKFPRGRGRSQPVRTATH